jgi:uncharacterized OB-fold protein
VLPIPLITEDNEAFWTGGRDGRLLIVRCSDCGNYSHPPAPRCSVCFGDNVAPVPVSGRGRVYSFTVNRQPWSPELEVPYVVAIVELDEQPELRVFTNIVGCPADEVEIGMPVEVEFIERGPAFLPVFHPVSG